MKNKNNHKAYTRFRYNCAGLATSMSLAVLLGQTAMINDANTTCTDSPIIMARASTIETLYTMADDTTLPFGEQRVRIESQEFRYVEVGNLRWEIVNEGHDAGEIDRYGWMRYLVDPDTGNLFDPSEYKPYETSITQPYETSITQRYVSSDTLPFNTKSKPVDGVIRVGNVETIDNGDGSTTYKRYQVDPTTGKTANPTVIATTGKVTTEPIKAVVNYVADSKVKYGDSEVVVKPKDGLKTITNMDIVKDGKLEHHDDKVDIVNPINGETHVGNKKTETDKDGKTTITVYNVDPKTGKLINPKVISKTIIEPEFIPEIPVAESGIKIGGQADSKTAETADTKATGIKSNADETNATKPTAKTHVSLQTGVDNAGRLATVMASVSALIAAAYAAIRRRKD